MNQLLYVNVCACVHMNPPLHVDKISVPHGNYLVCGVIALSHKIRF